MIHLVYKLPYVKDNPLVAGNELKMTGDQYFVVSIPNGFEACSNFHRTCFPQLQPNPYPASEIPGEFIRRYVNPDKEQVTNKENPDDVTAFRVLPSAR